MTRYPEDKWWILATMIAGLWLVSTLNGCSHFHHHQWTETWGAGFIGMRCYQCDQCGKGKCIPKKATP